MESLRRLLKQVPQKTQSQWRSSNIKLYAVLDLPTEFSVYDCFARGVSRVRASCTVPRLQVRPLVSNNEDLNSQNSLETVGLKRRGVSRQQVWRELYTATCRPASTMPRPQCGDDPIQSTLGKYTRQ